MAPDDTPPGHMLYFLPSAAYKRCYDMVRDDPHKLANFATFFREVKPLPNGLMPSKVYVSADGKRAAFK